jgi:hypothetical protein
LTDSFQDPEEEKANSGETFNNQQAGGSEYNS